MKTINDVVGRLKTARINFKEEYRRLIEKRDADLKHMKENLIMNSPSYNEREQEIKDTFQKTMAELKIEEMEAVVPHIKELREQEIKRTQKIDEVALAKINAISNIPLTEMELQALNSTYNAKGDYWCNRALAVIAENNGIVPANIGIEPTLDIKLALIDELSNQLEKMLAEWNPEQKHNYRADVLLDDMVLERVVERYTNGYVEVDSKRTATSAYWKIKTASSENERAIRINNAMRNLSQDGKNMLMYKLVTENKIPDFTKQMSGLSDVFAEWENGKAKEYGYAVNTIKTISTMEDETIIKQHIDAQSNNQFLDSMLKDEAKNNPYIKSVMYPNNEVVETKIKDYEVETE